jgi:hypothetical protein
MPNVLIAFQPNRTPARAPVAAVRVAVAAMLAKWDDPYRVRRMRRVACALASAALFAAAAAAPASAVTGGQWVAVDSAGGSQALFTLNPTGAGERTIYAAPAGARLQAPQWSPDGNRIVFAETAGSASRVLVYDLASARATVVAPDGSAPTWASDGTRIAFVRGSGIFIRRIDGGGEVQLPLDGTGVRDMALAPDGESLALWVGDHIDLADALSGQRQTVGPDAVGGAAWTPDSDSFVYSWSPAGATTTRLRFFHFGMGLGGTVAQADGPAGTDLEPDWEPGESSLVYTHRDAPGATPSLEVASLGSLRVAWLPRTVVPSQPDWQPCATGVTTSCASVAPPYLGPPPRCPESRALTVLAGRAVPLVLDCSRAVRYEIVDPPAHGTLTLVGQYLPAPGFAGQDTVGYRAFSATGAVSPVARVVITVVPRAVAPTLVVGAVPRLDRHGRTTVHGTCDRACVVWLHVRVSLRGGRVVNGRAVRASAPAGGAVRLRLRRGRLPAHARVVRVRILGRVRGSDGRERAVRLAPRG